MTIKVRNFALVWSLLLFSVVAHPEQARANDTSRVSAEQGNSEAQFQLGLMYEKGDGVPQDYGEALKWYEKSAEQGNADGESALGDMYSAGHGIAQNYSEALKWYRKSADQGNSDGQVNLGNAYANGAGVAQDYGEARKWFEKSADQGNSIAQWNLGLMYDKGDGVTQDYSEALKWYKKSAEQGDADGEWSLGVMYELGHGIAKDSSEALRWFRKSADQGNSDGEDNLGTVYANGEGVSQDYGEAVKWFEKATVQGNSRAQYNLGVMYENGYGVAQDHGEARKWFELAANQGNENAQQAVNSVNAPVQEASSPPTPATINEQRVALVIGNGGYQTIPNLSNPPNDAQRVAHALQQDGFTLTENHVFINLGKDDFEHALEEFGDQIRAATAKASTVALFYYAGHGLEVNGVNYLVPISADPHKEADIPLQAVPLDSILGQMDDGGARLKIVILDACRSNPFSLGKRDVSGGLAEVQAPDGTLIAYSTRPGGIAIDGLGADSPYSEALAQAIREPDRGLFDVFNDAALKVKHMTNDAQVPWTNQSAIEGTFYFVRPSS